MRGLAPAIKHWRAEFLKVVVASAIVFAVWFGGVRDGARERFRYSEETLFDTVVR